MGYRLSIDLGTTYSAAAVAVDGAVSMVPLGSVTPETPTVVAIDADDQWLFGDRAARMAAAHPERIAREFKRRVGDPIPIMFAGRQMPVTELLASTFRYVLDAALELMGEPPESTTVTHPAGWGEFKKAEFRSVLEQAEVPVARLVSEPVAAAAHYLGARQLEPGATIAVFDFGGGTFDAAVLEHAPDHSDRFLLRGEAQGLERLGGVDLDAAVFDFVVRAGDLDLAELETLEEGRRAIQRLRSDVVQAKESLSEDTVTAITVALPDAHLTIRLTRSEFEEMVRPVVASALETVEQTISSAGLVPADLDAILLVGGSSRIPLVAQMVGTYFDTDIVVDAHPKHAVAAGAATFAAIDDEAMPPPTSENPVETSHTPPPAPVVVPLAISPTLATRESITSEPAGPANEGDIEPPRFSGASLISDSVSEARPRRWLLLAAIAVVGVAAVGLIAAVRGPSVGDPAANPTASTVADAIASNAEVAEPETIAAVEESPAAFADLFGQAPRSESAGRIARHDVRRYASAGPSEVPAASWVVDRLEEPFSSVLGAEGLVFSIDQSELSGATAFSRTVSARDQASGEAVWSLEIDAATDLTLVDDALLVSRTRGIDVVAWRTGDAVGALTGLSLTPGPVVVRSGVVVVNARPASGTRTLNVIAAIDLQTARLLWRHDEPTEGGGATATAFMADDDTVVYATDEQTIAFDILTGAERWRSTEFDATNLVLIDNNVLVFNRSGEAKGIDATTGVTIWTRPSRVRVAASDGVNVLGVRDGAIESFSLASGETAWSNDEFAADPAITLAVGTDAVFAASIDGGLVSVALETGETVWATDLGDVVLGSATDLVMSVAGNDLIVATADDFFLVSDGGVGGGEPVIPLEASLDMVLADGDVVVSAHAGFAPSSAPFVEPGPASQPSLRWQVERASDTSAAVATGELVIYVDDRSVGEQRQSVLIGADAMTGQEEWSALLEGIAFSIHVVNENVIVHTTSGFLVFESQSGRLLGQIVEELFSPAAPSFVVRQNAFIVAKSSSGLDPVMTIESVDLETETVNWQFIDEVAVGATHVIFGDSVALIVAGQSLVGVDLSNGEELWRSLKADFDLPGVFAGDHFLFARGLSEVAVIDGRTGQDAFVLDAYSIHTASDGVDFYLYDITAQAMQRRTISDGSTVWSTRQIESAPSVTLPVRAGPVYVVESNTMTALETSSGSVIWSMTLDEEYNSSVYGAVGANVIALTDRARISVYG